MNVLSLFDGMSCGQIALKELGIHISTYYASEIDKFAIEQTNHNFPKTIQLGDVEKWKEWDVDFSAIDLVLAGSPCQGFSFAGKQLAFDDPRSRLFFVFVDILKHIKALNPDVKFFLENVDMKRSHLEVITRYVKVFPININSNLVSAQNRNRWYWTNIATKEVGLFAELHPNIVQPMDRGIFLKDILDAEVDKKYYIKNPKIGFNGMDINGKGNTLRIGGRQSQSNKHNFDLVCIAQRGRGFNKGGLHHEKAPTLSANSWEQNNLVFTKNYVQWDTSGKGYKFQQDRAFYENGKHGSLAAARAEDKNVVVTNNKIRRLTPKECTRLQTIPKWYKWIVSETQQYTMLGNGWTVDVICHIFQGLKE